MADAKISQLTPVTGANLQDDDLFVVARPTTSQNFSLRRDQLFLDAPDLKTTSIQVTNIKANDGTASAIIADSTGVMTIASSVLTTTDINGGTIDGTVIGGSTPAAISGTTGTFSGNLTVDTNTLFVDAANNRVGVGTSNPAYKLDVVGGVLAVGNGTITGGISYSTRAEIGAISNHPLGLITNNTTRVVIDTSGNVGIGTASPLMHLHLSGTGDTGIQITKEGSVASRIKTVAGALVIGVDGANGDTERMRITSTGSVGIGTSSPAYTLDVAGTAQVKPSTGTDAIWTRASNDSGEFYLGIDNSAGSGFTGSAYARFLYATGAYPIILHTNNTERMRITSTGSVGIGTSSPTYKVDVNSGAVNTALQLSASSANNTQFNIANSNSNSYMSFSAMGTTGFGVPGWPNSLVIEGVPASTGNTVLGSFTNSIVFQTGGRAERMRIDASGRVGIGTSSPSSELHAVGAGRFTRGLALGTSGVDATAYISQYRSTVETIWGPLTTRSLFGTVSNHDQAFQTNNTERMRITSTGSVGIGTVPDSNSKLHVRDDTSSVDDYTIHIEAFTPTLVWQDISGSTSDFSINVDGGTMRFRYGDASTGTQLANEAMRIDSSGNLLVGTTSAVANERLNVVGSVANNIARFRNTNAAPYGPLIQYPAGVDPNGTSNEFIDCRGNDTTLRFNVRSNGGISNFSANNVNLSDERVKTDIVPLGSYWDKIKALQVVTYKYKDQTHDDDNIGLIAQQVEAVAPEFVSNDGFGDTPEDGVPLKSIYEADLHYATLKALQEAMDRIEALEARITALEAQP